MTKSNKRFIWIIGIELFVVVISLFIPYYGSNGCIESDLLRPFGYESRGELELCTLGLKRLPFPTFYLGLDAIIITIIIYVIASLKQKRKQFK